MKVLRCISLIVLWGISSSLAYASRTHEVKRTDIIKKVTIAGKIIPKQTANIVAPYNGYVQKIYLKVGDRVKRNQPLIKITESLLSREKVFPLRSPINGVVTQITKQVGSYLISGNSSNSTLMQVADLDSFFIESKVPEIDINKIKIDMNAVVSVSAILGKKYKASIKEISIAPEKSDNWSDRGKTQYPLRLMINNPDKDLRPGLSCVIDIIVDEKKDVLALPHEFLEVNGSDYFVELNSGKRTKVEIGIQNDFFVEIKSGLAKADKVKQVDFLKKATDF